MEMWQKDSPLEEIATALNASQFAIGKMVVRLRQQGIPLTRRKRGHVAGRRNTNWSHSEVEFLIRRRAENATCEVVAMELSRTVIAVNAMIQNLRKEGVNVPMFGQGVRRLWDVNALKGTFQNIVQIPIENSEQPKSVIA